MKKVLNPGPELITAAAVEAGATSMETLKKQALGKLSRIERVALGFEQS
jgi:hypothetical protein